MSRSGWSCRCSFGCLEARVRVHRCTCGCPKCDPEADLENQIAVVVDETLHPEVFTRKRK